MNDVALRWQNILGEMGEEGSWLIEGVGLIRVMAWPFFAIHSMLVRLEAMHRILVFQDVILRLQLRMLQCI